jgi:hypothetical protein
VFDRDDPVVRFKLEMLDRALPATAACVFGDVWRVDAGYTRHILEAGTEYVMLVDSLETRELLELRLEHPRLDFRKGDFASPLFMSGLRENFDMVVLFDVLLHQAPLLQALHLTLARSLTKAVIVQPVLAEQAVSNALVYLPGSSDRELLDPGGEEGQVFPDLDPALVNHTRWLWGMTASFVRSALAGEGFEIAYEETLGPLPNGHWNWWGAIAERRRDPDPSHWSLALPHFGLYTEE